MLCRPVRWMCINCGLELHVTRVRVQTRGRRFFSRQATIPTSGNPTTDRSARTRFAPSPTGFLHLGSLRTALYNYLLAKATGGQFMLRLEDTDRTRLVPGAESQLYEDLKWAGLSWDEGPDIGGPKGPYRQSERLPIYRKYAKELLERRRAYRCFCSKDDVVASQLMVQADTGSNGRYPGTCLAVSDAEAEDRAARGDAHVIRFKSSSEPLAVPDLVYRGFRKRQTEDDFIIMKTDGFPTYHFANVVDDHLMEVTHVIRGAEWLISTPMHVDLYAALGWKEPLFAHVGLLVNKDRSKLSKRNADIHISAYRDQLLLPSALLSFVANLGWRAPSKKGILSLQELVDSFDLRFTKGDIVTDLEKLQYYQRKHLERLLEADCIQPPKDLSPLIQSIAHDIERVEEARQGRDQPSDPPLHSITTATISPDEMGSLGPLHSAAREMAVDGGDDTRGHSYIHKVLRLLRGKPWDLQGPLHKNRYLFWRPSRAQLSSTLDCLAELLGNITVEASPRALLETIVIMRNRLGSNGEEDWRADTLSGTLASLDSSISCRDTQDGEAVPHALYKVWRWVLAGSYPGPPVHSLLELLGRQEVMARMDEAIALLSERDENARDDGVVSAVAFDASSTAQ